MCHNLLLGIIAMAERGAAAAEIMIHMMIRIPVSCMHMLMRWAFARGRNNGVHNSELKK
jgi:hypothetical protein